MGQYRPQLTQFYLFNNFGPLLYLFWKKKLALHVLAEHV